MFLFFPLSYDKTRHQVFHIVEVAFILQLDVVEGPMTEKQCVKILNYYRFIY